jgi:ABC1 atypical kinase-like domain
VPGVLREVGGRDDGSGTRERARGFRLALEQLGTTYLNLGQLLSSRPDLLPDVYIEELSRLVDEVPAEPFERLEPVIREDLGPDAFVSIDREPLATASVAQIHPALLYDGREVVVKVRRPGIVERWRSTSTSHAPRRGCSSAALRPHGSFSLMRSRTSSRRICGRSSTWSRRRRTRS